MKRTKNRLPGLGCEPSPGQSRQTPAERILALASRILPQRIALEEVQDARERYEENTQHGGRASTVYLDLLRDLGGACGNAVRMVFSTLFKEALKELFRQIAP